jgi:uncharacterized protein (DUF2461 family)
MAVTLVKPDGLSAREKVMTDVIRTWIQEDPATAKFIAKGLEQLKKNQHHKNGKWKNEHNGYFQISIPAPIFHIMRRVFPVLLPGEPQFATSDADIVFCMKQFPDLFQGNRDAKVAERKDPRPRHTIYKCERGKA